MENLQDEITKRQEELNQITEDFEWTYRESEKELHHKLMEHHEQSRERSQQTLGAASEQNKQVKKESLLPFSGKTMVPKVELTDPPNERELSLHGIGGSSALQKSEALSKVPSTSQLGLTGVVASTPISSQTSQSNKVFSGVELIQDQFKVPLDPKVHKNVPTQFVTAPHSHVSVGTH